MNIRIEDLLCEVVRDYERKEQQCWKSNAIRKMSGYCTEEELDLILYTNRMKVTILLNMVYSLQILGKLITGTIND